MNQIEVVEKLNDIVCEQAKIIDELYIILAQHIQPEDIAGMSVIDRMQRVANTRNEIGGNER
ncbi:MAG: hypothetical protein IJ608_05650 [Lachnospiraceae bacterium]|nr:hypothetical protein [Lachnospiraceae bacterium]